MTTKNLYCWSIFNGAVSTGTGTELIVGVLIFHFGRTGTGVVLVISNKVRNINNEIMPCSFLNTGTGQKQDPDLGPSRQIYLSVAKARKSNVLSRPYFMYIIKSLYSM
jgi:hypothetical protein